MVMGYQAYAGNGLLDGITTGVGLRKAYDDMKRQQQLQERSDNFGTALSNYYSAQDDAGRQAALQEMAKNDPASTVKFSNDIWNQQHKNDITPYQREQLAIERQKLNRENKTQAQRDFEYYQSLTPEQQDVYNKLNGKAWTTDLGRAWTIYKDPNSTPEDKRLAKGLLEYNARLPEANENWNYGGRRGTLNADIELGGQVEAEKERGKKEVELQYTPQIEQAKDVAKGQAKNELGKIAIQEQMPRVIKAAENVSNMTDEGVGPIEGRLTPLGVLSSGAEQNYENVMEMNRAMNSMIRQKLSAMGITGREMDTEREAARNLYLLNPTDPKGIREQKINNFFNNFLQMDVPQNNAVESLVSKYGLEE